MNLANSLNPSIATSIRILAENPEKRRMLGENGRKFLENELNSQKAYEMVIKDSPIP